MASEAATASDEFKPEYWGWGTNDEQPRVLHTNLRVKNFEAALRFYVEGLGMKILSEFEVPVRRVTGKYVGFGDFHNGGVLELTKLWDVDEYTHGTGYQHVAVGVPDVTAMLDKLEGMGYEVTTRPTILLKGAPEVGFVKDPDGYFVELIQTKR
jgi:lactoylglutathione lyase